jgi:DNA-binding IclR family transcriptional regulator
MRRENGEPRRRSRAELAFDVMRALASARVLWGRDGALPLDALAALVQAPAGAVARMVTRLSDEGIVEVSELDATVRFTDRAVRDMCTDLRDATTAEARP